MNQSTDKTAPLADINTQAPINYDQELAVALGLDTDINIDFESDFKVDKKIDPMLSIASNLVKEFQAEMVELSHKFRSAANKITALIFMPTNLLTDQYDSENKLQFSAILIEHEQADTSQSLMCFAPLTSLTPLEPLVSMIRNSEVENKSEEEEEKQTTKRLKMELQQQLLWFQEFGRHSLLVSLEATPRQPDAASEKTKRHLTLISNQVQAA